MKLDSASRFRRTFAVAATLAVLPASAFLVAGCAALLPADPATPSPAASVASPPPPDPAAELLDYAGQVRALDAEALSQEIARIDAARDTPARRVRLALALLQSHQPADTARALGQLQSVLDDADARPLYPLVHMLAARVTEQRELEDLTERQSQQLREAQRRIDQLGERLDALRAIERSLKDK